MSSRDPAAFMSYARRDDAAYMGKISELRQHLELLAGAATGRDFHIFQDVEDIGWGEHWPSRLDDMLHSVMFLIPIVTPSFFNSAPCRQEMSRFLELERRLGRRDLVLPIYFRTAQEMESGGDPLADALRQRQFSDFRELRHLRLEETAVLRALDKMADEIAETIQRVARASAATRTAVAHPDDRAGPDRPPAASGAASTSPGPGSRVFRDRNRPWCPEMLVVPPGAFYMGSPAEEAGRRDEEGPLHDVRFSRPFALGRFPVTYEEFQHFTQDTARDVPVGLRFSRRPVVNVSWDDAAAYADWLSDRTGHSYRLPSEAEWEYACRAGTATPFSTGADIFPEQANYRADRPDAAAPGGAYEVQTTPVGTFPGNAWGFFDMHGNVWEWVEDCWHPDYAGAPDDGSAWTEDDCERRVLRGGSWFSPHAQLRSACRNGAFAAERMATVGFRVARSL